MTEPWREKLIEVLSADEWFYPASPAGGCPYEGAKLDWDSYARQKSIDYLKRVALAEDFGKNPSSQTP
jgi:hypothetical protein